MIRLLIGDTKRREDSITLSSLSVNKLKAQQLVKGRFLIDIDEGRLDMRKLKALLKECKVDLDLRTNSYDRYDKVKNLVDEIEDSGGTRTLNIFHLLQLIFTDTDRDRVFRELEKWKPPLEVLLKWMMGNIAEDDDENRDLLNTIDRYLYVVDTKIIHLLISHFEPIYSWRMRFYYRFKKKGE